MDNLESYDTVKQWMGRLAPSTQKVQLNMFKTFMSWVKVNGEKFSEFTPDQIVEYQKAAGNGNQYDILDLVQRYVSQSRGTFNTKNSRYNNIRSFFVHNRTELPRDPGYTIRPTREPVRGTLTVDELKQTILSCNACYQAIFLSMFQGFMDQECFTYWNWYGYDDLMRQLREIQHLPREEQTIKIDLPGRKSNKNVSPFYTFIGADAIDAIRNWLQRRPTEAKAIFTNQFGIAPKKSTLRHYWISHLRRLGYVDPIKKGTKATKSGKGLHEMRDVARSLWDKSPASSTVAEYCMGHTIDDLGYNKSFKDVEYYRIEYVKAVPFLQIMSGGEAFGRVDKSEVDRLRRELEDAKRALGDREARLLHVEQTQDLIMRALKSPEAGSVLWKALKELEEKAKQAS